ncbi:winged helix-turn-helix domain-containing protein [soil metagenome]
MKDGPLIASVASLIGDPARANMLTALMDGRSLTVSELANVSGVTLQTASGHLAKLGTAHLVSAEKQGRHHYFRLSGDDIGELLETLMGVAQRTGAVRVRTGPRDEALRSARVCYDHLAGERGVALLAGITKSGLVAGDKTIDLTKRGRKFFTEFGIDLALLEGKKRPLCRSCLDWSERRWHLAGGLGAAILSNIIIRKWAKREDGRAVHFTPAGLQEFNKTFGLRS